MFNFFLKGSTGGGGAIPTAAGLGAATASSWGGGAGGKISPYKHRFRLNKIFERKIVNIFLPISFNICIG